MSSIYISLDALMIDFEKVSRLSFRIERRIPATEAPEIQDNIDFILDVEKICVTIIG